MRITQLVCNAGEHFKRGLVERFNLGRYISSDEPAFWFGVYGIQQINRICNHKSLAILCWTGGDIRWALANPEFLDKIKNCTNIKHIAISNFIENDLNKVGIPYTSVPVLPYANKDIIPVPLGDSVYIYKPKSYGAAFNVQVKKACPNLSFIECGFHSYSRLELLDVYKQCFIGLRFIDHDGLSNTVCELGLMGRKVIWNGNTPNSIAYDKRDISTAIESIKEEYDKRSTIDYLQVSQSIKSYLDIGDTFLKTESYD
jgi:hypothetical protein